MYVTVLGKVEEKEGVCLEAVVLCDKHQISRELDCAGLMTFHVF